MSLVFLLLLMLLLLRLLLLVLWLLPFVTVVSGADHDIA